MTREAAGTSFTSDLLSGAPEALLQTALLAGGVGLWEWQVDGPGMALSPYLATLLGHPSGDFAGTKTAFLSRLHLVDRPRFELAIANALAGTSELDVEFRVSDLHGGLRCFAAKGRVMHDVAGGAVRVVGTMQEIPPAVVTERRMRRQQSALLALVSRERDADLQDALARITEVAGSTLDVERTSVWLFSEDRAQLVCRSLYRKSLGRQMAGGKLDTSAFPAYIRALDENRALDVSDARTDPRTRELADDYLAPLGITSMLEATVRMDGGELAGVVCHEHVGPAREWLLDEKSFAASIADMVTRTLTDQRRRRLTEALAKSEERYRTFVSISTEAILAAEFDPPVRTGLPLEQQADEVVARAVVVECNPALARMLGVRSAETLGGSAIAALLPEGVARQIAIEWIRSDYRLSEHEFQISTTDGRVRWVLGSSVGVLDDDQLTGLWSTWRDITGRKAALDQLAHLARHDSLTGLPNRTWLNEQIGERIVEAQSRGESLALLLMDLDRFKEINDVLGHHAGDQLLKLIGPRLEPLLEAAHGEIARLGGDEFAMMFRRIGSDASPLAIAADVAAALREPFPVGMLHLGIDASLGAAIFPLHGSDASTLLRCADIAMYEAKRRHLRVQMYSPDLDRHSPRRLALANALAHAIAIGQITLHYQPIVSLRKQRLVGVEALARWQHPEFGMVRPGEFIPIAEMGDQIRDLTIYVVEEAARQSDAWRQDGFATTISINLSTRVLMDRCFAADVRRILETQGLPGASIHFEITESAMLSDPLRATEIIADLNALGIGFSIDDFGIGFSSLSTLKQLPLASLKIDQTFIAQVATNERDASIVRSTIDLAHGLGLNVIGEGVESTSCLETLARMGCDQIQGYIVAPPMAGSAIVGWARSNSWNFGAPSG
jgi:diguanylate cyclase (GGDEF)-like protein/PAS domain S-box-containing protein